MSLPLHRVRRRLRHRPFRRPFDPALVLYFPFFEGSGDHVTDESPYGNHGSWTPETWTEGKIGPAPLFDGIDDYVEIAEDDSLDVTTLTLMAWIKTSQTDAYSYRVITRRNSTVHKNTPYQLNFYAATGNIRIIVGNNTTFQTLPGTSDLRDGKWHFIAATADGSLLKVYVDGLSEKEAPQTVIPYNYDGAMRIGGVTGNFWDVDIDEVRIYSRALEAHEIEALYRATV